LTILLVVLTLPLSVLAIMQLVDRMRPARDLSSPPVVADIFSGIAAVAALVTIWFARQTVSEARKLLAATVSAHQQEMAERQRAYDRELWLQRLTQLGNVQDLLGEVLDSTHAELHGRGFRAPTNIGLSATQLASAVLNAEAAIVILGRLGGPVLAEVLSLLGKGRIASTSLQEFVADVTRSLAAVRALVETEQSLGPPARPS